MTVIVIALSVISVRDDSVLEKICIFVTLRVCVFEFVDIGILRLDSTLDLDSICLNRFATCVKKCHVMVHS